MRNYDFSLTFPDGHKEIFRHNFFRNDFNTIHFLSYSADGSPLPKFEDRSSYDQGLIIGTLRCINIPRLSSVAIDYTVVKHGPFYVKKYR